MHELKCRTARLWLQAPGELNPLDARHLDRHLGECVACTAYRHRQVELDEQIRQTLSARVGVLSVRDEVRARLQTQAVPRKRRFGWPRLHVRAVLVPLFVGVPLSAALALALLLVPPALQHRQVTTTLSAWHVVRPAIGYPMTVDPNRPNHLLAGALGAVYESWNYGNSWRRLGKLPPAVIRDLAVDATHPNRYLVATNHSVLISDDAGKHWHVAIAGLLGAMNMFLMQDHRTPSTFYVGPSVLWRSTNHGQTWAQAGAGRVFMPYGVQSLTEAPSGNLFTGIWGGGVAVSRDQGITWQRRAAGLDPHVLTVALQPNGRLWAAAANHGLYTSSDSGLHWRHTGPAGHFYTTSVIATNRYVLVGGNGGVFRSRDGGKHWAIATSGLPMAAYVYGFIPDPKNPRRVYVSLDSDGIYRSDDGGKHWQSANTGLPFVVRLNKSTPVFFLRSGVLWHTDSDGTDPGNSTIDNDVKLANIEPDSAGVAYVNGVDGAWTLKTVSAYGSTERRLLSDTGPLPHLIEWSPNAAMIAVVQATSVTVLDLRPRARTLPYTPSQHFVGWSPDGKNLLFWDSVTRHVLVRNLTSGQTAPLSNHRYAAAPVPAQSSGNIALVYGRQLRIGSWRSVPRTVARVSPTCRVMSWSDDSTRVLLACKGGFQERGRDGRILARAQVPVRRATWVPGSHTGLLFFLHGALWRWGPGHGQHIIVPNAHAVQSGSIG